MIDAETFKAATGLDPRDDDLERCNCSDAGKLGHYSCGWNVAENMPVFMVGPNTERGRRFRNERNAK